MLSHQNWQSEQNILGNIANITNRTVSNIRFGATCHSGIKLDNDGILYTIQPNGGFSAIIGEWNINGPVGNFFAQRTILNGGSLEVDPGTGFLQLNADRIYDNQKSSIGLKRTTVFFEISDDAGGTNIIATATMTFDSTNAP